MSEPIVINTNPTPRPPEWVEILAQPIQTVFGSWQIQKHLSRPAVYRLYALDSAGAHLLCGDSDPFWPGCEIEAADDVEAVGKALRLVSDRVEGGLADLRELASAYPADDDTQEIPVSKFEVGGRG